MPTDATHNIVEVEENAEARSNLPATFIYFCPFDADLFIVDTPLACSAVVSRWNFIYRDFSPFGAPYSRSTVFAALGD